MTLGACGVVGGGVLLYSSPWGLGLSPDSVVYIGAARSLWAGHGFSMPAESALFSPITHYPPLYSLLLAITGVLAVDPLDGAIWLNVAAFTINIYLSGFLLFAALGSWHLALLGSLFTLTAFPLVQAHTMAWSEALFIMLELLSLLLLLQYLEKPQKQILLIASTVAGLSLLCRYVGFALIASGLTAILFLGPRERRDKLTDALVFAGIAFLPAAVWGGRNWHLSGNAFNRTVSFHPTGLDRILDLPAVVGDWFSSFGDPSFNARTLLWLGLMMIGFVLSFCYVRQTRSIDLRRADAVIVMMVIVLASYMAILSLSLTFLDAQIPVDSRTLSPIYVPSIILLIVLSTRLVLVPASRLHAGLLVSTCLALLLAAQLQSSANWLRFSYQNGIGYAARAWRESQTLNRLKRMPATVLFSNAPDVLYTLLNKRAVMVPRKTHADTNLPNRQYLTQVAELRRWLKEDRGLLVYFYAVDWRWYLPAAAELERILSLDVLARENDGVIYQAR
jgi:hypothetical protein